MCTDYTAAIPHSRFHLFHKGDTRDVLSTDRIKLQGVSERDRLFQYIGTRIVVLDLGTAAMNLSANTYLPTIANPSPSLKPTCSDAKQQ